jgi:hypothetical protein
MFYIPQRASQGRRSAVGNRVFSGQNNVNCSRFSFSNNLRCYLRFLLLYFLKIHLLYFAILLYGLKDSLCSYYEFLFYSTYIFYINIKLPPIPSAHFVCMSLFKAYF